MVDVVISFVNLRPIRALLFLRVDDGMFVAPRGRIARLLRRRLFFERDCSGNRFRRTGCRFYLPVGGDRKALGAAGLLGGRRLEGKRFEINEPRRLIPGCKRFLTRRFGRWKGVSALELGLRRKRLLLEANLLLLRSRKGNRRMRRRSRLLRIMMVGSRGRSCRLCLYRWKSLILLLHGRRHDRRPGCCFVPCRRLLLWHRLRGMGGLLRVTA